MAPIKIHFQFADGDRTFELKQLDLAQLGELLRATVDEFVSRVTDSDLIDRYQRYCADSITHPRLPREDIDILKGTLRHGMTDELRRRIIARARVLFL